MTVSRVLSRVFQGVLAADSSSCGQRVSLQLNAYIYGGLAQGPVWAARGALTTMCLRQPLLSSSLLGLGQCLVGQRLHLLWQGSQLEGLSLVLRAGTRQGDLESLSLQEGGCFCPCLAILAEVTPHQVKAADVMSCRGKSHRLRLESSTAFFC